MLSLLLNNFITITHHAKKQDSLWVFDLTWARLNAVESILRPQQPTRVLTARCPNFSANYLAATIVGSDSYGCLVGMHHLLII